MKVAWAQDFDILTSGGGAQLTDRAHFLEGVRRGHDLQLWTPNHAHDMNELTSKVLVIASNPTFFTLGIFETLNDSNIPYVYFFHDYIPICKYRLFYPMRDTCKACYLKERWLKVLARARLLIWLSPLHRESWLWLCPELESVPFHLSPSPVNVDDFHDLKVPRKGAVAVESLNKFKGRDNVIRWAEEHSDVEVDFVGRGDDPYVVLPKNCKTLGDVPYSYMNEMYNHYEMFVHLPQSPSPFDRTVVEAYLAGCRVIGNRLIGALSWDWFRSREEVSYRVKESSQRFWEKVEEVEQYHEVDA